MSLVELHAIHKSFGALEVLKGIDLSIDEGQVIALIGKSGSGKSTLLRTINGLEAIDDGVIMVGARKSANAIRICWPFGFRSAWYFSSSTCFPITPPLKM